VTKVNGVTANPPLRRTITPIGDPAWLVTDYDLLRQLLTDRRLGRSHPDPANAPRFSESWLLGRPQQASPTEEADHTRMRRLLSPWFGARPMARMRPRVQQMVDGLLDDLAARTPPVDFHEAVSFPLPALAICELLGVPYADRDQFRAWSTEVGNMVDEDASTAAAVKLYDYLLGLVTARLTDPSDDVLTALVSEHRANPDGFGLHEAAALGMGLLFAGHETTVTSIDNGIVQLSNHPDQRDALLADPDLVDGAVEEILRVRARTPTEAASDFGVPRWANADIDVGDTTIRAGEMVLLGLNQANSSPRMVGDHVGFDVRRQPNPHISFGHGLHFCIGAPLARVELQVLFATLLRRFPTLRLAVPVDQLQHRPELLTGGVVELPVTW
jgi:cytochrome P450